jgi:hypothetical protein
LSAKRGWSREFDEPIPLPDGRELVTLRNAGEYISALSPKEQKIPQWETTVKALILVAEITGPTIMARIRTMQALHGVSGTPREPRRKRVRATRSYEKEAAD